MSIVFEENGGGGKTKPCSGPRRPRLTLNLPPAQRAAGWERQIAPPVLKEVEVVDTLLSDDVHTIGLPPRVTQPSVGRFLREVKHHRDASFGSHFGLYGGVNLLPVFGERMKTVPTVPRTHHHFGTGVNPGYEKVKLHPRVLGLKVVADRANWVPAPSAASATVVKLARPSQRIPAEHQAVFPFPRDPAAALARHRGHGGPDPRRPGATPPPAPVAPKDNDGGDDGEAPMSPSLWPRPFWYHGDLGRASKPVGNSDDYGFCKLLKASDPATVREDLEINSPDYYVPGQIALNENKALDQGPQSLEEESADNRPPPIKEPLYRKRILPIRPPQEHYLLNPWIGQEREKLEKVGLAFRSDVCRQHYLSYPPGEQPFITLQRSDYPDLRLSTL